jgi:hypothetical protein
MIPNNKENLMAQKAIREYDAKSIWQSIGINISQILHMLMNSIS